MKPKRFPHHVPFTTEELYARARQRTAHREALSALQRGIPPTSRKRSAARQRKKLELAILAAKAWNEQAARDHKARAKKDAMAARFA